MEELDAGKIGLLRIAIAPHIGRDDVEVAREVGDILVPFPPEAGPAVEQEEGRAAPFAHEMQLDVS